MTPSALNLDNTATARIAHLLADEPAGTRFRIAVEGGGCSGFQYKFSFDTALGEDDAVIEHDGARVVVDAVSQEMLKNATLKYVETLGNAGFELQIPGATARCGCGSSFSV